MLRTKGYTPSYNCEYWLVSLTTQRYSPFLRGAVLRPPMRLESGKVFSTPTPTTLCPRGTLVGEDTEHRLDPVLFGNAKALFGIPDGCQRGLSWSGAHTQQHG
jgi:hypothetical protein